jgi:ADP-ribose pyrophosphatase
VSHQYEHDDYTHPDVYSLGPAQGWAEAEDDPTRIDWRERQLRAAIPFQVTGGRPVNPCEKTRVRHGRNQMGFWGENRMADALVTLTCGGDWRLLMVERADGNGLAVPGGHIEPGETGLQAALRELAEETGLDAMSMTGVYMVVRPPRYVPDPRASDEAWAVTYPVHIDLGDYGQGPLPAVEGSDDAIRAGWIPATTYHDLTRAITDLYGPGGRVFPAHVPMLSDFLGTWDGGRSR